MPQRVGTRWRAGGTPSREPQWLRRGRWHGVGRELWAERGVGVDVEVFGGDVVDRGEGRVGRRCGLVRATGDLERGRIAVALPARGDERLEVLAEEELEEDVVDLHAESRHGSPPPPSPGFAHHTIESFRRVCQLDMEISTCPQPPVVFDLVWGIRLELWSFLQRIVGEIKSFTTDGWVAPKLAKRMDKFMLYLITVGTKALENGGLTEELRNMLDKTRCGVLIGSAMGGMKAEKDELRDEK